MPCSDIVEWFVYPNVTLQIECVPDTLQVSCIKAELCTEPNQFKSAGHDQGTIYGHQICQEVRKIEQGFVQIAQLGICERLIFRPSGAWSALLDCQLRQTNN